MTPSAKALANGAKRPLKTSALNPYAMRPSYGGEVRISPRIAALDKAKFAGRPGASMSPSAIHAIAERKANYVTGTKAEARQSAAEMVRRYRKTGNLSAIQRLTQLNADLTEFAYGDRHIKRWSTPSPEVGSKGLTGPEMAGKLMERRKTAEQLRAARAYVGQAIRNDMVPHRANRLLTNPKARNDIARKIVKGLPSRSSASPFLDAFDRLHRK